MKDFMHSMAQHAKAGISNTTFKPQARTEEFATQLLTAQKTDTQLSPEDFTNIPV
jgi:hypothetical protein